MSSESHEMPRCCRRPGREGAVELLCRRDRTLDRDRGCRYDDYVRSRLSESAQGILEVMLPAEGYVWKSDFALEHRGKGRCEGEATIILDILEARDIAVTSQQRDWITQCTEEDTLRGWARRAATASTADEIFG